MRRGAIILSIWLAVGHLAYAEATSRVDRSPEIRERATNQFAAAIFLKPAESTNTDLASQLAPLLLQQVPDKQSSAVSHTEPFGDAAFARDMPASSSAIHERPFPPAIGASRNVPVVFFAADNVELEGRAHLRFSYEWSYAPGGPAGSKALSRQGIRITLDTRGQPAVWEVLADTSGLRLIFVSQRVEGLAAGQFGKPWPGRRFTVERAVSEFPGVVVPRVLDDGPVAMGPIIYLQEGTRDVTTVICRCMPAQVKRLVATQTFDLTALDGAALAPFLPIPKDSNAPPVLWPAEDHVENRLDHCLRLPANF